MIWMDFKRIDYRLWIRDFLKKILGFTDRISVQGHREKFFSKIEIRFKLVGSNFAFIGQFRIVLPEIEYSLLKRT